MRDLEKDLEICAAATKGLDTAGDGEVFTVYLDEDDGVVARFNREVDAAFFVDAATGWPEAIQRALDAEAKVDRLENELRMLQDSLNRRCMD
ncbi:hypothetical protein J31TS4_16110 [Paenibacillus sp. J31TS4]|uniref:hypothetical protein n=1 Tax=Paenibacillus sp. J31TS4 TaxID=2807195 RepID=UPI001B054E4E|nr:hypothetical protein [Paenibacillus sp. J31TS4]GIP38331.1 hypothetical protein J31TS4_16110 [Paenibacillus sp. J31TS4]